MGKIIGLDIGVASVGWAVVENDDNGKIIELGSNIFDSADASKNKIRRDMRQRRRILRRSKNRIKDFNKLWLSYGFKIKILNINNQLDLRVKGLKNELNNDEFYAVLVNLLKHRGITYLDDISDEELNKNSNYKKYVEENIKLTENDKFPCEIQFERLNEYKKYRGIINDNNLPFINVFTRDAYNKEIDKILECQKKYNNRINDSFIEKYKKIFNRKREYYEGPGSEKSRTDYGIYTKRIDKNGNYITLKNLFEQLIGKSSILLGNEKDDKEKLRASAASYTAQEFNVLNDLNNIRINGDKLNKNEKIKIIDFMKNDDKIDLKYIDIEKIISKALNKEIESITGYRIDKDGNPEYHNFKIYRIIKKQLDEANIDYDLFDRDLMDEIAHILTINTEKNAIADELKSINISQDICENLIKIRINNKSIFSKWHSLSLKVMKYLIPYMYEENKEQNTLIQEELKNQKLIRNIKNYNTNSKKINKQIIIDEIYNPVVRRSVGICIDILNALIKKYHNIESVIIEMPRDKNSEEETKRIDKIQKENKKEIDKICEKLRNEYEIHNIEEKFKIKNLSMKLRLWNEQDGKCLYSGEKIDIYDLIENPNKYEIDHIIPISISFDDSRNNKVLVLNTENQNKKNNTPFTYLNNINREYDYKKFKHVVKELFKSKKINKIKQKNLLFEEDINKIDVLKGFINRNINDTRYASRVVLNLCQDFFKSINTNVKVKTIRGSFTSQMRKNLKLEKIREDFSHHAIDAVLICYAHMGYVSYEKIRSEYVTFDSETGEILDIDKLKIGINEDEYNKILYDLKWKVRKDNILSILSDIKYWHKVDKKVNRALCNQTIRATREIEEKKYKINSFNIYESKKEDLKKKLIENKEKLLVYKYDKKTYENLVLLFKRYEDSQFPFKAAKKNGECPKKYAKDNNGTEIKKLKYLDGVVETCIDISHKYGFEKGSKKVILESLNPYRSDVYYNENDKKYIVVGIKYNNIKCVKNKYEIIEAQYNNILKKGGVILDNQTINDIKKNGFVFKFSLYKNDYISYYDEKTNRENVYRFLSSGRRKSVIEVYPIEKAKFTKEQDGTDRLRPSLLNVKNLKKINKDILGNRYYIDHEKLKLTFKD